MANTLSLDQNYPDISRSQELYAVAEALIPCGTQTLAKGVTQHVQGVAPVFLQRGQGSHVWDVDGNEYLDYSMGIGPLSLGYCVEEIDSAIRQQLDDGIVFSLPHELEVEVAQLMREIIPNAEMTRFSKTGADVCSAAIRIARAATGRDVILCCGYHGWHDWYIATTDRTAGIPSTAIEQTFTFDYNDIDSLVAALDESVAAVILEPCTFYEPHNGYLQKLRELCTSNGTLLIFDEMWTGFRLDIGGAQKYFGVQADLACFSKAVANGMPLSMLCGQRKYMSLLEKDIFFFTTFGGEALSLAAAKATVAFMLDKNVAHTLHTRGRLLKDGINTLLRELNLTSISCVGFPCRTMLRIDAVDALLIKSYIQQELIKRGILWNGFHNISYSHSLEDIDFTLAAYHEVLVAVRKSLQEGNTAQELRGTPLQPVFRKTTNFNSKPKRV